MITRLFLELRGACSAIAELVQEINWDRYLRLQRQKTD